jgi:endonuclease/exonuclease/phosphatase (EEP) superfamily protein YafD
LRTPTTASRRRQGRGPLRVLVRLSGIAYLVALTALAALVYWPSERLWPITLFLFGPRWVFALPFVLLLPLAMLVDRRLAAALGVAGTLLAEPLFGLSIPWRRLGAGQDTPSPSIRVVTWNVGGGSVAPGALDELMTVEAPDVILLQESGRELLESTPGWYRHADGGMSVLSRFPILGVAARDRSDVWRTAGSGAIVRYTLDTPLGRVDLTSVHLETPREGLESILRFGPGAASELEAKNAQRLVEARLAREWVDASSSPLRLVAGDFNTPVESYLFRDRWRGFRDCHSAAGWGFGFTKHTRRIGTRIDHLLAGPGLECVSARVGPGRGGDHSPLVVEVGLEAP